VTTSADTTERPKPFLAVTAVLSICTANPVAKSLLEQMAHPASMITGGHQLAGDQSPTISVPSAATVSKSIPEIET
jgi:hypothetical protein